MSDIKQRRALLDEQMERMGAADLLHMADLTREFYKATGFAPPGSPDQSASEEHRGRVYDIWRTRHRKETGK